MHICKDSRAYVIDHCKPGFNARIAWAHYLRNEKLKDPCEISLSKTRKEQPVYWNPKRDVVPHRTA
jgi:hypothetical protein